MALFTPPFSTSPLYLVIKELIPFQDVEGVVSFVQTRIHLVVSKKDRYTFPPRSLDVALSPTTSPEELHTQKDLLIKFYGLTGYFMFTSLLWDTNRLLVEWLEYDIVHDIGINQWKVVAHQRSQTFSYGEDPRFELFSIGKSFFVKTKRPGGLVDGSTYEFIVCKTPPVITA